MLKLLPPTATPLESALYQTGAKDYQAVKAEILSTLYNPKECPVNVLPFLAWALSVDVWDEEWDEKTKRQVIAASIEVHKYKGTIGALKKALEALDLNVDVVEWFDYDKVEGSTSLTDAGVAPQKGKPYYFKISINVTDKPIDALKNSIIWLTIMQAKNVRSWLEKLTIWILSSAKFFIGAATQIGEHIQVLPFIQTNIEQSDFNPFVRLIHQTLETVTITPRRP